jgi:hypothetical protein
MILASITSAVCQIQKQKDISSVNLKEAISVVIRANMHSIHLQGVLGLRMMLSEGG